MYTYFWTIFFHEKNIILEKYGVKEKHEKLYLASHPPKKLFFTLLGAANSSANLRTCTLNWLWPYELT